MRCKESQFQAMDPGDIIAYRKRDLQTDVLVSDRKEAQKKYRDAVVDPVSVDEIMLLLVKGNEDEGTSEKQLLCGTLNVKMFSAVMLLLGIAAAVLDNDVQSIIIGYMISAMAGFSVVAVSGLRKENTSKWCRYKLTAPVRRIDIVKVIF